MNVTLGLKPESLPKGWISFEKIFLQTWHKSVFKIQVCLNLCVCLVAEVHGTENPHTKRPAIDAWFWQESARKQHLNERKTKMKTHQIEDPRTQKEPQVRSKPLNYFLSDKSGLTSSQLITDCNSKQSRKTDMMPLLCAYVLFTDRSAVLFSSISRAKQRWSQLEPLPYFANYTGTVADTVGKKRQQNKILVRYHFAWTPLYFVCRPTVVVYSRVQWNVCPSKASSDKRSTKCCVSNIVWYSSALHWALFHSNKHAHVYRHTYPHDTLLSLAFIPWGLVLPLIITITCSIPTLS